MSDRTLGFSKNNAAALSYMLFFISGIFFFIFHKDSFVRFHAAQSIFVFVVLFALQWIVGISIILSSLVPLIGLLIFVLWLTLIYKAWQGDEFEVPVLGHYARRLVKK